METQKNDKKIVLTSKFLNWVENRIKHYIKFNPKFLEFSALLAKQESETRELNENYKLSIEKLESLESMLSELNQEIKQFNISITTVRNHISSLDEKNKSTETLRSMIYAIWDVQVQITEPKVKEAEMILRSYRHLLNSGPEKRSKVNNENISGLFKKRWTDADV